MSHPPANRASDDALAAWALSRHPQSPPETPISDDLLVGLATGTLTTVEREHLIARLASDPDARELAEGLMIEAEAMGIAPVPARSSTAALILRLARRPMFRAAGLLLAATVALIASQLLWRGGSDPLAVSSSSGPFGSFHRLTDLGFEPGAIGRLEAKSALDEDKLPSARELRETLARSPDDRQALLRYGYRLLLNSKPDADRPFRKVLDKDPLDRDGLIGLGEVLYTQPGGLDEAIRLFRAVLARDPNNASIRLNLAMSFDRAGKAEEASQHYKAALQGGLEPTLARKVLERLRSLAARGSK